MPAYHSQFNPQPGRTADYRLLCGMALLPLKTKVRGPAPTMSVTATPSAGTMTLCVLVYNVSYLPDGATNDDIIDEALFLFRPNCFFKNYEIQGPADRTLIYLQLFLGECLAKIGSMVKGDSYPSLSDAQKALQVVALASFSLPGDPGFPLNAMYDRPKDRAESDLLRQYISQMRQEVAIRLPEKVYSPTFPDTDGGRRPSKWWMCFQKRKFMNKSL